MDWGGGGEERRGLRAAPDAEPRTWGRGRGDAVGIGLLARAPRGAGTTSRA